uniref:Uncharacterized protein n=1 Tax=Varanus komodoensis TaxID=61221 RepID=A0A8D2KUM3_VARKO
MGRKGDAQEGLLGGTARWESGFGAVRKGPSVDPQFKPSALLARNPVQSLQFLLQMSPAKMLALGATAEKALLRVLTLLISFMEGSRRRASPADLKGWSGIYGRKRSFR